MYKIFKKLLPVAEEIGTVLTARQTVKGHYTDNDIRIEGTLPDGREFTLKLEVKDLKETPDAS